MDYDSKGCMFGKLPDCLTSRKEPSFSLGNYVPSAEIVVSIYQQIILHAWIG
jgi:hypothetical protein